MRRERPTTYLFFAAVFALIVLLSHASFLRLPYFWDELGQFVPASLDILREGAWIPRSTTPNVHPPGLMGLLALVWRIFGYSIPATRITMLLLASASVLAVFLLAIQVYKLSQRRMSGAPAFAVVGLLLASPLFFTQAMLVQLDMPCILFTALTLFFFFREQLAVSVLCATLLVLVKETGVVVPLVLGGVLWYEKRFRDAAWFCLPVIALAGWLVALRQATGSLFGNHSFEQYNLWYPLHPIRLALSILRRFYFVFFENLHWVGTAAIVLAWKQYRLYRSRVWVVLGFVLCAHLFAVSLLGGAVLERYVLPVLPIFYIAVAAAWATWPKTPRHLSQSVLIGGLLLGLFWNPPWPFPLENNLAFSDFVRLQMQAAEFTESTYPSRTIYTAWPFSDALRRPEFGYVTRSLKAHGLEDFHRKTLLGLDRKNVEVLILYSRTWEPDHSVLQVDWIRRLLTSYYAYEPQISSEEIQREFGLFPVGRWERRGQWIEIFARDDGSLKL